MCKHILIRDFDLNTDLEIIKTFTSKTHEQDGYGAIFRTTDAKLYALKSLDVTSFYIDVTQILCNYDVKELVLHHRTSTNGDGLEYAHPFEYQGNYLTHNGVVTVPGEHETKTTNDSEALLHHLIKSDFDTAKISGYFSCFILNETSTTVLVDQTAPIHSDGRVFQSHNFEGSTKIELKRMVFDLSGGCKTSDISVTKSDYGYDKASLSLGWSGKHGYAVGNASNDGYSDYPGYDGAYAYDGIDLPTSDVVLDFWDCLTEADERAINDAFEHPRKLKRVIRELAWNIGLNVSEDDVEVIAEMAG